MRIPALVAAALAISPPAAALDYDSCLALARADPPTALAEAEAWVRAGGGPAAEHCAAMALADRKSVV